MNRRDSRTSCVHGKPMMQETEGQHHTLTSSAVTQSNRTMKVTCAPELVVDLEQWFSTRSDFVHKEDI